MEVRSRLFREVRIRLLGKCAVGLFGMCFEVEGIEHCCLPCVIYC